MKYKILREKEPQIKLEDYRVTKGIAWECRKENILWGPGEILKKEYSGKNYQGMRCPNCGCRVYSGDMDYWDEKYDMSLIK